jgi:hypothetical protein
MDLAHYAFKEQLWNQLWSFKYRACHLSTIYDRAYNVMRRVRLGCTISTALLTTAVSYIATVREMPSNTITALSLLAVVIKVIQEASGVNDYVLQYYRSSQNYKYLHEEINRIMTVKRSTVEFREAADLLFDLFMTFEQSNVPILSWIHTSPEPTIPSARATPSSPVRSRTPPSSDNSAPPTTRPIYAAHIPHEPETPKTPKTPKTFEIQPPTPDRFELCRCSRIQFLMSIPYNVGYFFVNPSGAVIHVDGVCCRILAAQPHELLHPSVQLWQRIHSDDVSYVMDRWVVAMELQQRIQLRFRLVHVDGTLVYVIHEAYPCLDTNDQLQGMQAMIMGVNQLIWESLDF